MTGLIAILFGVLGVSVGSFLNVVVYRVPRGESVVRPGSRCPDCGVEIRPRDNVPVVSWVLLRGRCRACGVRVSVRYPLVELATAGLWVGAALRFENLETAAFVALVSTVLLALAAIDLEHHRLPNAIVYPSLVVAAGWVAGAAIAETELGVVVEALAAGASYFVLLFLLALVTGGRGMGMGDVKLAAFLGLVTGRFGWEVTLGAVMAAFVGGGLVALFLLLTGRAGRKTRIPFGPALAAGTVLALFAGPTPVRSWLGI